MFKSLRGYLLVAQLMAAAGFAPPTWAAPPDSTLYTTYELQGKLQWAYWTTCGSTQQTEGCYSSGSLGPFGRIGAILESRPVTNDDDDNTVMREIYVLDVATGSAANGVSLYVYKRIDVVSATDDAVTVSPERTIPLPLVGGSSATASMAGSNSYLFVGTNQSTQAVSIRKHKWFVVRLGAFEPPMPVQSITTNSYGYVTVTVADPAFPFRGAFTVFGPDGAQKIDGGGSTFMVGDRNAVTPDSLGQ